MAELPRQSPKFCVYRAGFRSSSNSIAVPSVSVYSTVFGVAAQQLLSRQRMEVRVKRYQEADAPTF